MLIFYFYCNLIVIDVAQFATITKLGFGIFHAHILTTLYFDLQKLDVQMRDMQLNSSEIKKEQFSILSKQKLTKNILICFFVYTISTQSFISFDPNISIRLEFGLQAFYYFLTLIVMVYVTHKLIQLIRKIFGDNNAAFDAEIRQVKNALLVFAFAYSLRVIRNSLVTILWEPCFPVHRQLTTNLVNLIFYLLSDWIAIFFMLRVHNKNYSDTARPLIEEEFVEDQLENDISYN